MALRTKTIEYAFNTKSPVLPNPAGSGSYSSSLINVYIPETGSRVFTSAWLEFYMRDSYGSTTNRGTITERSFDLQINGANSGDITQSSHGNLVDTGEQVAYIFAQDFTNHFNTMMGSTVTQSAVAFTASWGHTTGVGDWDNLGGKLVITYNYNDAQNRRVKTVRIPIDKTGSLKDKAMLEMPSAGNPQVPALDTFCPEANKAFRNIWFEMEGSEWAATTTDTRVSASLDSEGPDYIAVCELSLGIGTWFKYFWVRDDMDTSTTHSLKMGVDGQNGSFLRNHVILYATYEYDHAPSTRILNSVMVPYCVNGIENGSAAISSSATKYFSIQEPGPIDMKQSGLLAIWGNYNAASIKYNVNTGSLETRPGSALLNQHFSNLYRYDDSGSVFDWRIPLNRGFNPLTVNVVGDAGGYFLSSVMGYHFINYHSNKHALGDSVHNQTVKHLINSASIFGNPSMRIEESDTNIVVPNTNWYLNGKCAHLYWYVATAEQETYNGYRVADKGSARTASYNNCFVESTNPQWAMTVAERAALNMVWDDVDGVYAKYPEQPTFPGSMIGVLHPMISHSYSLRQTQFAYLYDVMTYHGITYDVTGSVSGSGAGIPLGLYCGNTKRLLATGSTTAGGNYAFTWYDDTCPVFVEALSASLGGRSANGYAN